MEKIELANKKTFSHYAKALVLPIQTGLQKFSNNILIKSLVAGFVASMPVVLVSSFFILMYALPEAIAPELLKNQGFLGFKAFAVRTYQFTYGILGLVVTANIARAMMEELNIKLAYNRKVATHNVLITAIIAYFIMSAVIPGDFDPAKDAWFEAVNWAQMGAQGILPGILIGLTTPYAFFYCYKYNITIRLPKSVPAVISQAFLAIIPFAIAVLVWSLTSYIFIVVLGQPFIPWFFQQLSAVIPQLTDADGNALTVEAFKELEPSKQTEVANNALSSFANSYGIIVLYRFLESFSWFMGVHPQAIHGVFDSIMAVNLEMNVLFSEAAREESFAFVNALIWSTGTMGGTGNTFIVPFICLMFCRSTQSKVAGKTSAIPVFFQVNEPILFGQPIVLNPYFMFPFIFVPMINSVLAKVFVDFFGLDAATFDMPWSTPFFIRGPVTHLGQPIYLLLLLITFALSFVIYLPFVLWYDKALVKLEIEKVGKDQFISMNGIQWQLNKLLSYDNTAHKKYKENKKTLFENSKELSKEAFETANVKLLKTYNSETIKNLFNTFQRVTDEKLAKATEKYNNKVNLINDKMQANLDNMNAYNEKLDLKIESINANKEFWGNSYQKRIDAILAKKKTNPKVVVIGENFEKKYKIKVAKIKIDFLIRKNIILKKRNQDPKFISKCEKQIALLNKKLNKYIATLNQTDQKNLVEINKKLAKYINPFGLENANKKDVSKVEVKKTNVEKKSINVLVLCIGAGTSAMLANAINEGSREQSEFKINANALSHNQYKQALSGVDLIITSPQLGSYLSAIKSDAEAHNIKVAPTKGKQYIDLCNNPKEASIFTISQFKDTATENEQNIASKTELKKEEKVVEQGTKNILVLCIGAGTSAMLANAINEGSREQSEFKINANALSHNQYKQALSGVDLIITSPQLGSYLSAIKSDAKTHNIKVAPTKGKQYIDLCNNPKDAANFAIEKLKEE